MTPSLAAQIVLTAVNGCLASEYQQSTKQYIDQFAVSVGLIRGQLLARPSPQKLTPLEHDRLSYLRARVAGFRMMINPLVSLTDQFNAIPAFDAQRMAILLTLDELIAIPVASS